MNYGDKIYNSHLYIIHYRILSVLLWKRDDKRELWISYRSQDCTERETRHKNYEYVKLEQIFKIHYTMFNIKISLVFNLRRRIDKIFIKVDIRVT